MNRQHSDCPPSQDVPKDAAISKKRTIAIADTLQQVLDTLGGLEALMSDPSFQTGNKSGSIKIDGQTSAQYGEFRIEAFLHLLDTLQSNGSKISAFIDIGAGLGNQTMLAGFGLDVCSRGIELMKPRYETSMQIYFRLVRELEQCGLQVDTDKVCLKQGNLANCVSPPNDKKVPSQELRDFVLFADMAEEVQKGVVIFANNAHEVFAARCNGNGNRPELDAHLAELFGNLKVGGRIVTFTDIRRHLRSNYNPNEMWYRHESFYSKVGACSWSPNKPQMIHVLTKISEEWLCRNKTCEISHVVDEAGKLTLQCPNCKWAPRSKRGERAFEQNAKDGFHVRRERNPHYAV